MKNFVSKYQRHIAMFFLINFVIEVFSPAAMMALTSGPTQPEVQEFQPISVSDMVDPATGDFSYNLPLFDVDGYPVNLSYRAGASMDQEATCIGLGWNMNVGTIARNLRGIPDDFDGDVITKKINMKENISYGITLGVGGELFGTDAINASVSYGLTYNNYTGYDFIQKVGITLSLGSNASVGLGLNSSADGLTLSPNLSLQASTKKSEDGSLKGSVSVGTSFNSRTGMKEVSLNAGISFTQDAPEKKKASDSKTKKQEKKKEEEKKKKRQNKHDRSATIGSIDNSSSIMFGSPTFVPQITMPMHTSSMMGSFKLGGTVFGIDVSGDISGTYSKQTLKSKSNDFPAYGYLNLQNGQDAETAMMDFNREKDGNFTEATTNLPIPNLTYDNFSVMGQGVGGSYRPFRSDIGYVYDPRATNSSESNSIGAEIKLGNLVQGGADFINTTVEGSSGKWSDQNPAVNSLKFSGSGYLGYEPAYFKEMGEMNVDDDPLYTNIYQETAVRYELDDQGSSVGLQNQLITENSVNFSLVGRNKRSKRVKRNQLFSYLTVSECENFALQTALFPAMANYTAGNLDNGHHIGQITTTKTDGTRYVYGLPVYNNQQKETSFNVSGFNSSQYIAGNNMVLYTPGVDDNENNVKGIDGFFTSTEMPPYAYAYLLTAVLSPDYVDKTGDGPSADDIGTYTLFRYNTAVDDYEWRTPQSSQAGGGANFATLEAGLLTNNQDNKASYVYGKKDIKYLSSIESKNHIATLLYSDRQDGRGAAGSAGGTNTSTKMQKKLDKITLYSMADYVLNPSTATKIKEVNFTYNYELCPGVYNFSGSSSLGTGKLTLKSVYFTYGNSNKGVLAPYIFNYNLSVNSSVVSYDPAAIDRWGNYKPNNVNCPNSKFPYVEQSRTLEDQYVSLWNLKSIQLPSGGLMRINYESDDYAFIQDKRAGEMAKIEGCTFTSNPSTLAGATDLYGGSGPNLYLWFRLKPGVPANANTVINEYIGDLKHIYFRFYTNINCVTNGDISALTFNKNGYEFVQGYAEIDRTSSPGGWKNIGGVDYGYVKVKSVRQSKVYWNIPENPISKTAWQMARLQTPKEAYSCIPGTSDPASNANDIEAVMRAIANSSFIKNIIQTVQGYNGTMKANQFGKSFEPTLSWIRLYNPDCYKLGGGLRVKDIRIADKWEKMLSTTYSFNASQGFEYGQQYSYVKQEFGKTISSGVASYEPTFGADENSFRKPIYMEMHKEEALLAPDNDMYVEEPLGESFFPSPSVVYDRVEVKSLIAGAGATVNEYYTARDFPTYVHELGLMSSRKKPNPIMQLFSFSAYDRFTGSQGYSIELNDMHGKPKSVHTYAEGAVEATKSTIYTYMRNGNKLLNTVKVVSKNGNITDSNIGIDYDFYADFRENNTKTEAMGVQGNIYWMMIGIYPVFLFPMLPSYHSEEIQMRTAVTNKVIYKYGILEKVETRDNKNSIVTNNLLWDAETGKVLLTGTTTEFGDPIYTTNYPGHWAYEGFAGGYKDVGFEIPSPSNIVSSTGQIINQTYINMLYPGDELALYSSGTPAKGYVDRIGGAYYFTINTILGGMESSTPLDQTALSGYTKIKVIRSGRHNLQDENVGSLTSFISPLNNSPSSWPLLNETYRITNASTAEYGNTWQGYCGCNFVAAGTTATNAYPNQYIHGIKGNYRKIKDYTFLTSRTQSKQQGNSNIRIDGTFETFTPFWTPNGGTDWVANTTNWTWVNEATRYSPYGVDLENKDALERRSAAQYGYNQSLPVAVTVNSKYQISANENFEYNDLNICQDDHFGYNQYRNWTYITGGSGIRVQKYSHTGKRSIKVAPTGTVTVTKQLNPCQN